MISSHFVKISEGLLDLIFPELCPCCNSSRPMNNHVICLRCMADLPFTGHEKYPLENETAMVFWGRVKLEAACSVFYFHTKGKIRGVLHRIKYEGRRDLAVEMGKLMGHYLGKSEYFRSADLIVPVPLHPSRKAERGFNQCDYLAKGLSERLNIHWTPNAISRTRNNPTQTRLSREKRFENTDSLFAIVDQEKIRAKNLLLIDDVLTTGATLESCIQVLLDGGAASITVATLACGEG